MITLGLVDSVDDNGVYVRMPGSRGLLRGPFHTLQNVTAGDRVLVVRTDDGEDVIVGQAAAESPRSLPTSSTDNTVARYDGTGGALQGSGVTINDDGNLTADGVLKVTKDGSNAWVQRVTVGVHDIYDTWAINGYQRFYVFATQSAWGLVTEADLSGGRITALSVDRTTGKTTLGSVGSTAGLEFGSGGPRIMAGTGSPESVVSAPVGSLWLRTDSSTTLYVKQTGTGNTGWIAK